VVARADGEKIWEWYQIILKYQAQDLPQKQFCDAEGIDYDKFCAKLFRIVYKKNREPELYNKWLPIARKYLESGMLPNKFVKIHDISIRYLSEMSTHLRYIDTIEEIKKTKEKSPMNFIKVPTMNLPMPTPQEPEQEVLKKQNDVELIISKGVKVVVSPEVGADKLIRIIELLKDL
jgi:hypothetical protein